MTTEKWTIEKLFADKPGAHRLFDAARAHIEAFPNVERVVTKSQVAFGAKRKFAWLWLAPATKKDPEGILMLTLDMTHKVQHELIKNVQETYRGKWTHQIPLPNAGVIKDVAQAGWFEEGYKFGSGDPS